MFTVVILNPKKVLFEGQVRTAFLQGDQGEFEILPYHSPVITVLRKGRVILDGQKYVPVKKGLARFAHNELVILVEQ